MVFSSIPVFVDPPNWNQQQQQQQQNLAQANNGSDNSQLLPPLAAHQPPHVIGSNSIRPGSMADRARLAKIPPPEPALKCPRCDSTNTKFCYFNNYSLSQPRHFCKTCRRYWTRGGALRNVPVGGGCRRNKKNKRSSRSKSPSSSSDHKQTVSGSTSAILPSGGNGNSHTHELIGQLPQPHNLPFMASLQNLNRYAVGNMDHMGFQIAGGNSSSSGMDQWRLHHQHVPNFLNGFESTNSGGSSYPFQNDNNNNQGIETASGFGGGSDIATNSNNNSNSRVSSQIPSVKMEENGAMNHLSRASLNASENNNQYYSWTDMSGSATHYLL